MGHGCRPEDVPETDDEFLVLVSDISPFEQFMNNFTDLGTTGMDGSLEMLTDALYLSVRNISPMADLDPADTVWWRNTASIPEKENFTFNWRPDSSRIVIIFSDEPEQTYLKPANEPEALQSPLNRAFMESVVRAGLNLKVYTFSTLRVHIQDSWEELAQASGGIGFRLTSNPTSMYNDLMSIIDEACLPRNNESPDEDQGAFFNNFESEKFYKFVHYNYNLNICM